MLTHCNKKNYSAHTLTKFVLFFLLLCSSAFYHNSFAQASTDDQLSKVKQAIDKQKTTIKQVNSKREKLLQQLKTDDLSIAKIIKQIAKTNQQLLSTKQHISRLLKEKSVIQRDKKKQESTLAKQLRAAYSTGHHDYLKLILNQEDPASVQRTVAYYRYLNSARIKEIDQYKLTIQQLTDIATKQNQQAEKLQMLEKEQTEQKTAFQKNKRQQSTKNDFNLPLRPAIFKK